MEGATIWGIANGLGAHTIELNNYELGVQFKASLLAKPEDFADRCEIANCRERRDLAFGNCFREALHCLALYKDLFYKKIQVLRMGFDGRNRRLWSCIPMRIHDQLPTHFAILGPGPWWLVQDLDGRRTSFGQPQHGH